MNKIINKTMVTLLIIVMVTLSAFTVVAASTDHCCNYHCFIVVPNEDKPGKRPF